MRSAHHALIGSDGTGSGPDAAWQESWSNGVPSDEQRPGPRQLSRYVGRHRALLAGDEPTGDALTGG
jgi:hypothetical protein